MKNCTRYNSALLILIFLASVLFAACTENGNEFPNSGAMRMCITLQPSRLLSSGTRVADAGKTELNENIIKKIDLFLYQKGKEDEEPAFYTTIANPSYSEDTKQATLTLDLPIEAYYKLFHGSSANECTAYVIANREEPAGSGNTDNALPSSKTLLNLKANTVLFASGFKQCDKEQTSFVMDGQGTLTKDDRTLSGEIPVSRVAAKVTLEMSIADKVNVTEDDKTVTWIPDRDNVYVIFRNVMLRTNLGMTPSENIYSPQKEDLHDMNVQMKNTNGHITLKNPFYTYPSDWRADETSRPHMVLVINWKQEDNQNVQQKTYYEIPINDAYGYVLRNNYYRIIQEVQVLGSPSEKTAVELTPSYVILNWGNSMTSSDNDHTNTDATISKLKYLVVDETNIVMQNTMEEQIVYFSSDPIEVSGIQVWHMDNSGNTAVEQPIYVTSSPTGDGSYTFTSSLLKKEVSIVLDKKTDGQTYINFHHDLVNEMSQDSDYSQYRFRLTVRHKGDNTYNDVINITQYPMIPIKAEQNSDFNDKSNSNTTTDQSDKKGYVFVNANQNSSQNYGGVHGLTSTAKNKNPNRYIITATALGASSGFILGDPRTLDVDMTLLEWATNNSSTETSTMNSAENKRKLLYYHPTEESERTKNMISPQFMIASSYAVTNNVNRLDARRRCATYQEDGYPAGRWRVPTDAEVRYIMQLSGWKIIPKLFTENNTYWTAHGGIQVDSYGNITRPNASSESVRCVYDTWYWKDKCNKTKFTWGDKAGDLYN